MDNHPLNQLTARFENNFKYYLGYPQNIHFDYSALIPALSYAINNYGDPFILNNPISSHEFELEVIRWFLRLYNLPDPLGWGYVTTGGTEGIIFGVWQAKENLDNPILYFSSNAHYAAVKAAKLTGLDYKIIQSEPRGQMSLIDFEKQLMPNRDAIIIATLGTTMTSAIDDVKQIKQITKGNNLNSYIHADAAFDGMILPFIKTNYAYRLSEGVDSVSISGHKVIGAPLPCGVFLSHSKYTNNTKREISYINNTDCSLSGSRSGLAALILWEAIRQHKRQGFKKLIAGYLKNAAKFTHILNEHQISAWRFEHAITIVLDKQPKSIMKKWRAPSDNKFTTLTALPKLKESMLYHFIEDINYFKKYQKLPVSDTGIEFPKTSQTICLDD